MITAEEISNEFFDNNVILYLDYNNHLFVLLILQVIVFYRPLNRPLLYNIPKQG